MNLKRILLLSQLLLASFAVNAQLVPLSLENRIVNSDVVFEGKVISKTAAWDAQRKHIYTTNLISVYKVFKGEISSSMVEVQTIGGTVGNDREDVSYGLKLNEGSIGIFTCVENPVKRKTSTSLTQLKVYSEIQGFIRYDLKTGSARDVFKEYNKVTEDIYVPLQKIMHSKYKIMNKADFKIK
jgi:hypothetical protein